MLHNLETLSAAVRAFTVLECTLAVLHNLHASRNSFSERVTRLHCTRRSSVLVTCQQKNLVLLLLSLFSFFCCFVVVVVVAVFVLAFLFLFLLLL